MKHRKKLIITGAGGFLGWNVCRAARADWDVCGLYHTGHTRIEHVSLIRLDLTEDNHLRRVFRGIQPDAVIHTAAMSRPGECQANPQTSRKINVQASVMIAELCAAASIPLIFTSTDLVFDGKTAPYAETSPVNPINMYGEQKVLAEAGIMQAYPEAVICRMPLMFGYSGSAHQSFTHDMIVAIQRGDTLRLFTDEYRTPVDAGSASAGLLMFLSRARGILHLGGATRISRYEMGLMAAALMNKPHPNIVPVKQTDMDVSAPRPADVSLDSRKAESMGYRPEDVRMAMEKAIKMMRRHGMIPGDR